MNKQGDKGSVGRRPGMQDAWVHSSTASKAAWRRRLQPGVHYPGWNMGERKEKGIHHRHHCTGTESQLDRLLSWVQQWRRQYRNKKFLKSSIFQVRKLKLRLKHLVQGHILEKRKSSELKVSHEVSVPATRKQCHREGESCPFESCSRERHFKQKTTWLSCQDAKWVIREAFTFTASGGGTGTDLLERKATAHVKIARDGGPFAPAAPPQGIWPSKTIMRTHAQCTDTHTITRSATHNSKKTTESRNPLNTQH